eukprot:768716-Hanusia_phi.AAC.11
MRVGSASFAMLASFMLLGTPRNKPGRLLCAERSDGGTGAVQADQGAALSMRGLTGTGRAG